VCFQSIKERDLREKRIRMKEEQAYDASSPHIRNKEKRIRPHWKKREAVKDGIHYV